MDKIEQQITLEAVTSNLPNSFKNLENLRNAICLIEVPKFDSSYNETGTDQKGTGFFLKTEGKKYLFTCNHVLGDEFLNNKKYYFKIYLDKDYPTEEKHSFHKIDLKYSERFTKTFKKCVAEDTTVIEILPEDNIPEECFVLKPDEKYDKEGPSFYSGKLVFILGHPKGIFDLQISIGLIDNVTTEGFYHNASSEVGNSGSAVISCENLGLMGIHYGGITTSEIKAYLIKSGYEYTYEHKNRGNFIGNILDKLKDNYNAMYLQYKIKDQKVKQSIRFFNQRFFNKFHINSAKIFINGGKKEKLTHAFNYDPNTKVNEKFISHFSDPRHSSKKSNENTVSHLSEPSHSSEKSNEITVDVKLIIYGKLTDLKGLFLACEDIKKVCLSQCDGREIKNISFLFSGNASLEEIFFKEDDYNINDKPLIEACPSKFVLRNDVEMEKFVSNCISLKSIAFPPEMFDSELKYLNMDGMFAGCIALKDISFPSKFNIPDNYRMKGFLKGCCKIWEKANKDENFNLFSNCGSSTKEKFRKYLDEEKEDKP